MVRRYNLFRSYGHSKFVSLLMAPDIVQVLIAATLIGTAWGTLL